MTKTLKTILVLVCALVMLLCVGVVAACNDDDSGKAPTGIVIEEELELTEGESKKLEVTLVPADATTKLTWAAEDPAVATVSTDGTVTAVKAGTTIVSVTTENEKTAECIVTVKKAKGEAVTFTSEAATHNTTVKFYPNSNIVEISGQQSNLGGLKITAASTDPSTKDADYEGTYAITSANKISLPTQIGFYHDGLKLIFTFPVLTKVKVVEDGVEMKLYSNNGSDDFVFFEKKLTKAEGEKLGFDMTKLTVLVSEITWDSAKVTTTTTGEGATAVTTYNVAMKAGETLDVNSLVKSCGPTGAEFDKFDLVVSSDSSVVAKGTSIYALKAGTSTVNCTVDGTAFPLTVSVTYPDNPYSDAVKYENVVRFNNVTKLGDFEINTTFDFFSDGMCGYAVNTENAAFGYYTLTKTGDNVTQIKYKLFNATSEVTATVTKESGKDVFTIKDANGADAKFTQVTFNGDFVQSFEAALTVGEATLSYGLNFKANGECEYVDKLAALFGAQPVKGYYNYTAATATAKATLVIVLDTVAGSAVSGTYELTETDGVYSFTYAGFLVFKTVAPAA